MLDPSKCKDDKGHMLAPIRFYKPTPNDSIAIIDKINNRSVMTIQFGKFLGNPIYDKYNIFVINKQSINSRLPEFIRTFNFFEYQYDTDHELLTAYLQIKHLIDVRQAYQYEDMHDFINIMYDTLFTKSICDKIRTMVRENWLDDVERNHSPKKKRYAESLEYNNNHIRCIMAISTALKLIEPIICHFIGQAKDRAGIIYPVDKGSDTFYYFYRPAFNIFSDGCDIYNKIYVSINKEVQLSSRINNIIFMQRGIFGNTVQTTVDDFIKNIFITDIFPKYKFTENWDDKYDRYKETVVGLNKITVSNQLGYLCRECYRATLSVVSDQKSDGDDENRGIDKMGIYFNYTNEGLAQTIEFGIKETVANICRLHQPFIADNDEVLYYVDNWLPTSDQTELIYAFYAKYFGDIKYCELIPKIELVKLVLILKKTLLIEYIGHDRDENDKDLDVHVEYTNAILPFVLSSNMTPNQSDRVIYSDELVSSIKDTYLYKNLEEKYNILVGLTKNTSNKRSNENFILEIIINFICATYELLDYYHPENRDKPITINPNRLSYELLSFLNDI